jgi:hypothetical protein
MKPVGVVELNDGDHQNWSEVEVGDRVEKSDNSMGDHNYQHSSPLHAVHGPFFLPF